MNCLGSLYTLMNDLSLSCALEEIYGDISVKHMMSGKAISCALKVHVLVDFKCKTLKTYFPLRRATGKCTKQTQQISEEKVEAPLDIVAIQQKFILTDIYHATVRMTTIFTVTVHIKVKD